MLLKQANSVHTQKASEYTLGKGNQPLPNWQLILKVNFIQL